MWLNFKLEEQLKEIPKHILLRASLGDAEAFETIYQLASGFVYSIALRITNNPEDAQDVTQDVFIKIYKNLKNFKFFSSFKTWVYRITVNTALNTCREISRQISQRADHDSLASHQGEGDPMTEIAAERADHERLIMDLLAVLNPDQRACIVLREIEGLNYREISEVLNININTVRSRLKRAREALLAYRKSEVMKDELPKDTAVAVSRLP